MSEAAEAPGEAAPKPAASYVPLQGAARVVGSLALSTAVFMNALDTSIANVSIPTIAGDLGVSASQGTWVITSFGVANAITVPLTGWLTQRFGQVRLFVTSTLLFVVASWLCGFAPSLEALVAFRVLQGVVAGPMIPLSQALMMASFPREKTGMALAIWSMTILVAPIAGPMLGGWISDTYSWPWIFYINVPIGLIAAWFSWRVYKDRESPTRHLPVDKIGLALLVVWVGALQIMLDKGQELDWFSSSTVVALAIVSVVAFVFFLIWELTEAHPIVDLRLFTYRNFTVGVVVLSVAFAIYFANVVLLPLWLQRFMHYTATDAGWATAPVGIFAILLMPLIGRLLATHDPRKMVTFSFMVFAIVSFMRANFSTGADMQTIIWPTLIQGIATATFFVPLTAISMSGLEPGRIPAASGLSNFARLTAGAFGTSITTTLWDDRASFHHARLTEAAVPGTPGFDHASSILQSLGMTQQQILAYLDQQIEIQSFTLSVLDIYYASALIFLLLTGAIWFARPR